MLAIPVLFLGLCFGAVGQETKQETTVTDLNDKKPELIKFTPTKIGKYAMYCDKKLLWFKSHRERGMEGVIEVVE
jgi:plastocyanin